MPRIAAAVAVVATIGISIGINIVRFPAVWDMLDRSTPHRDSTSSVPATMPAQAEPVIDLSQVAPPETHGLSGSETAPIRVPRSMPISLPTAEEPSAGTGDAAPEAQLVSTRSGASPEPAEGGSAGGTAGLSERTLLDSPAPGPPREGAHQATPPPPSDQHPSGGGSASPASLPASAQTQWPAETVASMRYAAKPELPRGELSDWRPKRRLVPVEPNRLAQKESAATADAPTENRATSGDRAGRGKESVEPRVFTMVSGKRLERLPPVDDETRGAAGGQVRLGGGPIPATP